MGADAPAGSGLPNSAAAAETLRHTDRPEKTEAEKIKAQNYKFKLEAQARFSPQVQDLCCETTLSHKRVHILDGIVYDRYWRARANSALGFQWYDTSPHITHALISDRKTQATLC